MSYQVPPLIAKTASNDDSSLANNSNNYSKNIYLFESIQLDNCYRNNPHVPDSEYYSHEN